MIRIAQTIWSVRQMQHNKLKKQKYILRSQQYHGLKCIKNVSGAEMVLKSHEERKMPLFVHVKLKENISVKL